MIVLVGVIACGDRESGGGAAVADSAATMAAPDATATGSADVAMEYAPELNVNLAAMARLPTGLYVKDLEGGDGDVAVNGRAVRVHYTGWLPNGVQFDSSQNGEPLTFTIGAGDVIKGWEEGVSGMRPGGRRMLVIPPALAYGERGYPGVIPPNSTLVFDVRLVGYVE